MRATIIETNLQFKWPPSVRPNTSYFILHHFGPIPTSKGIDSIDADYINHMHIVERGWAGIGYHFIIRPDGTIERGRPIWAMGAHDEGENAVSIGICLIGNFTSPDSHPTSAQMSALLDLLADLHDIYHLLPADTTIYGHRDNEPPETPTECPGDGFYALLGPIRQWVKEVHSVCLR